MSAPPDQPVIRLDDLAIVASVTMRTPTAAEVAGIVAELIAWNGDTEPGYRPSIDEINGVLRTRGFLVEWQPSAQEGLPR